MCGLCALLMEWEHGKVAVCMSGEVEIPEQLDLVEETVGQDAAIMPGTHSQNLQLKLERSSLQNLSDSSPLSYGTRKLAILLQSATAPTRWASTIAFLFDCLLNTQVQHM